jgi:hypothetical protein
MSHNSRTYGRQTTIRLIVGGLVLLFIVGDGLIYILYGSSAAITGLLCIGGGLIPIGLVALAVWLIDWVAKRANRD